MNTNKLVKFKSQDYFTKQIVTETLSITTEEALRRVLSVANNCKTAHLNDIQITKDGMLLREVVNRSSDLIAYLNGELDEFYLSE